MASISSSNCLHIHFHHRNPISFSPPSISFRTRFIAAVKTTTAAATDGGGVLSGQESYGADLLRKPVVSSPPPVESSAGDDAVGDEEEDDKEIRGADRWVDWEDQILEDTVPLVGFVRMILHSGKYVVGDRLSPEHERTILERLLPYHPEFEKKIGCGVDYITIGYHPNFENSRCMFIVRKDGEVIDFSYWKCIKGLIRKNYPLYADSFILRHFRRRRRSE